MNKLGFYGTSINFSAGEQLYFDKMVSVLNTANCSIADFRSMRKYEESPDNAERRTI
jgi:hypothetical protein